MTNTSDAHTEDAMFETYSAISRSKPNLVRRITFSREEYLTPREPARAFHVCDVTNSRGRPVTGHGIFDTESLCWFHLTVRTEPCVV